MDNVEDGRRLTIEFTDKVVIIKKIGIDPNYFDKRSMPVNGDLDESIDEDLEWLSND